VDVATAVWGGIAGAIALVAVYAGFLGMRLTRLDLVRFGGQLVSGERGPLVYVYGAIVLLIAGALLALGYRLVFLQLDSATFVGWGALLGLAQGVLVALLLPVAALADRGVRDGTRQRPGLAGRTYGPATPLAIVAANVVFGIWVGLFLLPAP
jgi:hypothetical protein